MYVVASLLPNSTYAWGADGHRLVAGAAEGQAPPSVPCN